MFSILRDIISPNPPDWYSREEVGVRSSTSAAAAAAAATTSSRSSTSVATADEMKRSREVTDSKKASGERDEAASEKRGKKKMPKVEQREEKGKEKQEVENVKVIQEPTVKEVECMPKKVVEKIRKIETTRVQPIVHRDRYQMEVHQVVQPIIEKVTKATILEVKPPIVEERGEKVVEATFVPDLSGGSALGPASVVESSSTVVSVEQRRVEVPPVIEEVIHRKIIEHITPLILKEVVLPSLEIVEALPQDVLNAPDLHAQVVSTPIVIERLVIRSGTESMEERLQRLEAKQQRKAQKRAAKEELKAQRRAAKMELKAQKQAAKLERKALKKALAQQELEQKADLAVRALHEKRIAELEMEAKQAPQPVPADVPAIVVTQVDQRESEELPSPVEVVTTVDEVTSKLITPEQAIETLEATSMRLKNFTPLSVTSGQEGKGKHQKRENIRRRRSADSTIATPQQLI